jgi:hypothetical protein
MTPDGRVLDTARSTGQGFTSTRYVPKFACEVITQMICIYYFASVNTIYVHIHILLAKFYNMFQPSGHQQVLYMHLLLICSSPYFGHVYIWVYFVLSVIYVSVQCTRLSFNIKMFKYVVLIFLAS